MSYYLLWYGELTKTSWKNLNTENAELAISEAVKIAKANNAHVVILRETHVVQPEILANAIVKEQKLHIGIQ